MYSFLLDSCSPLKILLSLSSLLFSVSLKFLMELLPLWMFYVAKFLLYMPLFLSRRSTPQGPTLYPLPFVNDLDLLRKKVILKSPMDWLPYPLQQLWQMLLSNMVE